MVPTSNQLKIAVILRHKSHEIPFSLVHFFPKPPRKTVLAMETRSALAVNDTFFDFESLPWKLPFPLTSPKKPASSRLRPTSPLSPVVHVEKRNYRNEWLCSVLVYLPSRCIEFETLIRCILRVRSRTRGHLPRLMIHRS